MVATASKAASMTRALNWLFLMAPRRPLFLGPLALWRLTRVEFSLYLGFLVFSPHSPWRCPIPLALGDMLVGPKGKAFHALSMTCAVTLWSILTNGKQDRLPPRERMADPGV